ncbi:hypothetical protein PR003_g27395 [Phytophthora rubi]|uniref:Uncharacterized protein n=1 Tax=Phytophthora rubi TaxID=129364 RepID=A0A6A3IMN7_9STRA|nr:hypothetical protein PF003_g29138 [Phytophthora fragariae]KAE8980833.1 hypothetical protein PR002_g23998 [Phytophthora rubi]KAE9282482.1 hypothetical protein PR003_g27395 [Phytophthora rubi]
MLLDPFSLTAVLCVLEASAIDIHSSSDNAKSRSRIALLARKRLIG